MRRRGGVLTTAHALFSLCCRMWKCHCSDEKDFQTVIAAEVVFWSAFFFLWVNRIFYCLTGSIKSFRESLLAIRLWVHTERVRVHPKFSGSGDALGSIPFHLKQLERLLRYELAANPINLTVENPLAVTLNPLHHCLKKQAIKPSPSWKVQHCWSCSLAVAPREASIDGVQTPNS